MTLGESVGIVAPYYNLVLAAVVLILFLKLFKYNENKFAYLKPWKLLFAAFLLFIVEEIMTVFRGLGVIKFHPAIFPLFEMIVITLFIYLLLLQKQFVKTGKRE